MGNAMIEGIDHLVLNCRDVDAMAGWYERVLGFERITFHGPGERVALRFGSQKINLRPVGASDWITGECESPGSLDLCLLTGQEPGRIAALLAEHGVEILRGPATRHGAKGPITSIHFRDPEGNLLEIASYD